VPSHLATRGVTRVSEIDAGALKRVATDQLVDGIASGPGDRVHQHPLLAGQLVQQARLADVRPPDQGHPTRTCLWVQVLTRRLWQRLKNRVEQVTAPPAVQSTYRIWLAEPE